MLGEDAPRGALVPSVTSGEAIIFCINDVQQPAMREMDSVRGRSAADDGRQRGEKERKKVCPGAAPHPAVLPWWTQGSDNLNNPENKLD